MRFFAARKNETNLTCIKAGVGRLWQDYGMNMIAEAEPGARALPARTTMNTRNDLAGERLAREWNTMRAMVRIYCRDHHQSAGNLCGECEQFLAYADLRLERCRYGIEKPTCAKCPVHCYQRERREQVRAIMRYAGPRMVWEHPIMSLRHWMDGHRPATEKR